MTTSIISIALSYDVKELIYWDINMSQTSEYQKKISYKVVFLDMHKILKIQRIQLKIKKKVIHRTFTILFEFSCLSYSQMAAMKYNFKKDN